MARLHNSNLKANAKELRSNMTEEERRLWYCYLKEVKPKFTRQKVIGQYIVDFYCARKKVAIEIDGAQHYDEDGKVKDERRDKYLKELGIMVLRYTNLEINKQFKNVCEDIEKFLIDKVEE